MQKRLRDHQCLIFVGLLVLLLTLITVSHSDETVSIIPVGVILDPNSSMINTTLKIALDDFYETHDSYKTRLHLLFNTSTETDLQAASAALHQINMENVTAIVGPKDSEQARSVVEYGDGANVPVIWFSPSGPSLLPPRTRFYIHSNTTRSHCSQFEAIAAIIKAYNWQSVIPIYEDPEFGYDLIPCLTYALQDMDTIVPYISAISNQKSNITDEIRQINDTQTHVFVVHMTLELLSTFMEFAKKGNFFKEGYAWILTQGLSSDLKASNLTSIGYMDVALGVKPSLDDSGKDNRSNLSTELMLQHGKNASLYELWAYDTITALAIAVENASLANETDPRLKSWINGTDFLGMSGNFSLRQLQLKQPKFEVYIVSGTSDNIVGHWTPEEGLVPKNNTKVKWPGNPEERLPKLKVGVPKKAHFTEFVNVGEWQNGNYTGLAVDVFEEVMKGLTNVPYEFEEVDNSKGYDDLLCKKMTNKSFGVDVIIGDITITADRMKCVQFTMPYLDSSVSMVMKVRSDSDDMWILFKPFDGKLWLILLVVFVGATVIVILLETRMKDYDESRLIDFIRNPFLIYMSDVGFLKSGTSKWAVIVTMFVLVITMQVYTAYLTATFSERTATKPSKDLQEIKRHKGKVGYQNNSWVKGLLLKIGWENDKLNPLNNYREYETALSPNQDGKKDPKVEAVFDETPYLMLLVSKCSSCKMTGPIYKAGGFAFAFHKDSTLVSNFSAAILKVTQNVSIFNEMKENRRLPINVNVSEYRSDVEMRSLTFGDFGGLFPIVFSILALFITIAILKVPYIVSMLKKVPPIAFLMEKVSSFAVWLLFKCLWWSHSH